MSEQERERAGAQRAGSQDVEAHRAGSFENDEPTDEERTEDDGSDDVEAHRNTPRAGT
jgi:hypothetical protein